MPWTNTAMLTYTLLVNFSLITTIGHYSVRWLETETTVLAELSRSSDRATQLIYNDTHASHLLTHLTKFSNDGPAPHPSSNPEYTPLEVVVPIYACMIFSCYHRVGRLYK